MMRRRRRLEEIRPARHRDAEAIRFRALAIRPGQKIVNLFKAAPHKAWNPIPVRVSQCLSTGCVDSEASRRRGDCEKNAKKASPRVRDMAPIAIRAPGITPGQKIANLFKAAPHKAWNPIPVRVSQCLSTGCVDSEASRRRGDCEKSAKKQARACAMQRRPRCERSKPRLDKKQPISSKPRRIRRETRFPRVCPNACPQPMWIATRPAAPARPAAAPGRAPRARSGRAQVRAPQPP